MRRSGWLLVLGLCGASCRDVTLPPTPPAGAKGEVFGRVVRAQAGSSDPVPAAGASVLLESSSLGTLAGADGHFKLDGISSTDGTLLFQLDSDGDGTYDLQSTIRLEDVGAGPERSVNLGDVAVSQNARLHGRVIRGDVKTAGGQVGTLVFVPQSSFSTYCADDGRYALTDLPPGKLELAFFRNGYLPGSVGGLQLRPAEDFAVDDVVLAVDDGSSAPGGITGAVATVPAGPISGATALATAVASGLKTVGSIGADGALKVSGLRAGLYDLTVTDLGFTTVVVPNVPVYPAQQTQVQVVLGSGAANDDGGYRPPAPDGGSSCVTNGDCAVLQWCDEGFCRAQCGSSAQCTNARVCDLATRTCVVPCSATCVSGEACDPVSQTCRPVCDGSRPCASGFQCGPNSVCVPQCQVRADCPGAHSTCQAGQCVSDGTCDTDLDCGVQNLCIALTCQPRTTAPTDAGYACTQPCDCRLDESCDGTTCIASPIPFAVLDAGADLAAVIAAAPAASLIGLRANDTFQVAGTIALTSSGSALTGGYVRCGPNRDVYDRDSTSTVVIDAGIGFSVSGTLLAPVGDIALRSLNVNTSGDASSCPFATVSATNAPNLSLVYFGGTPSLPVSTTCLTPASLLSCSNCDGLSLDTVSLPVMPTGIDWQAIALHGGNGLFREISSAPSQSSAPRQAELIHADQLDGPLEIDAVAFAFAAVAAGNDWGLIDVSNCAGNPVSIHDGSIVYPVSQGGGHGAAVWASNCEAVDIERMVIDGTQNPFQALGGGSYGIWVLNSGGTVAGNTIAFPTGNPGYATDAIGILARGPQAGFTIDGNVITGGAGFQSEEGIQLDSITRGPLSLSNDWVDGGSAQSNAYGLYANLVATAAALAVTDGAFRAAAAPSSNGVDLEGSGARLEQLKMIGEGVGAAGLRVDGSIIELYSSYALGLGSGSVFGLFINNNSSVRAEGNTIEAVGGNISALKCASSDVTWVSNIIGGGGSSPAFTAILDDGSGGGVGPCFDPSRWSHNYFWFGTFVSSYTGERVHDVAGEDAGVPDVNGNIFGNLTGCAPYDPAHPTWVIPIGSPCQDRGVQPTRDDNSLVMFDVDGNPRVQGAAADIGAYEAN